jgi:dTMP kinase
MTGKYIALEGIEGAGKSTIAAALSAALTSRGVKVTAVREPGGTGPGERIRQVLLGDDADVAPWTEALLFAAARAQLARDVIAPALSSGSWVIGDRSVYSSLAYQGGGRGLGVAAVRALNVPGLIGVWPDVVVLLQVDAGTGLRRQENADRIGAEGMRFQALVAVTFDEIAATESDRFSVVDASAPLDFVVAHVIHEIEARWPKH